ncbi:hypothetical protein CC80DRAFT_548999 [Byssothecium circinans]|uniref:Uncharacterized protein n=1 Tax=Byssothecium circinans TaxID=147558 RepID=A0A6A5TW30_9PLEO|nr:hypothetical protein CC80DRAFT_548999 [Byssothecium circinans]
MSAFESPDFDALAQQLKDISEKMRLCADMPNAQAASQLSDDLNDIQIRLRHVDRVLNNVHETIQKLTASQIRIEAAAKNACAVAQNKRMGQLRLMPLVNICTGEPIPDFPEFGSLIPDLTEDQLRGIFDALGMQILDNDVNILRKYLALVVGFDQPCAELDAHKLEYPSLDQRIEDPTHRASMLTAEHRPSTVFSSDCYNTLG